MSWFKEQFAKSTILSGLLALGIWGAIIYLSIAALPIPDILYFGGASVIAFFFGSKVGEAGQRRQSQYRSSNLGGSDNGRRN